MAMTTQKKAKLPRVAYFCMEFGLDAEFKIYSGGLGILAGDILKAAHDMRAPMVGVGILWRQGYVQQRVDRDGQLYDCFTEQRYDFLTDTGKRVSVDVRGRTLTLRIWKCEAFGNAPLYLLDAFLPENRDKLITGQLYGWFDEERIAQEIILGVGGVRALQALRIPVDIYHFNDSHPVLAGTELIRQEMQKSRVDFEDAWKRVRSRIVFTTHTPVPAGNECHSHRLLQYMGAYNGLSEEQMKAIGGDPFGMTVAGLRLSRRSNAVAQLHGETARKMWREVSGASRILSITNGVHCGTWQDARVAAAARHSRELWHAHEQAKRELLSYVADARGISLSPEVLTIGFGRRATGYKRSDLIFRNRKEIDPLLRSRQLQILFSGKAHPNDLNGKEIIARLLEMERRYEGSVVFLPDYDMKIGRLLTRGCDVWLNTPARPMEASGTSGMKAAMNGVLNFSVLDGWWPEGFKKGINGWQIGGGYEGARADEVDSKSLYRTLKREILPCYYKDRAHWVRMMKASIRMAEKKFSAERMLREYYRKLY